MINPDRIQEEQIDFQRKLAGIKKTDPPTLFVKFTIFLFVLLLVYGAALFVLYSALKPPRSNSGFDNLGSLIDAGLYSIPVSLIISFLIARFIYRWSNRVLQKREQQKKDGIIDA